jgi:hypothetical protein
VTTVALRVQGSQITVDRDPEGNPECDLESQPRFILRMIGPLAEPKNDACQKRNPPAAELTSGGPVAPPGTARSAAIW